MNLGAFQPYALLLKLGLVAVLAGSLFVGGCVHGEKQSAAVIAKKDAALLKAGNALGDAATSMRGFATTFDEISALTRANARAAEVQLAKGVDAAKKARLEHAAAEKRVSALEQQLWDERAGCVDAGRRVCGIPLQ